MTTNVKTFATKTPDQIRDDFLRTVKNALVNRGVSNPAVGPNSDFYLEATALANEISVLYANQIVNADQQMLDTAVGAALDRLLAMIGLSRRIAGTSAGFISAVSSYSAGSLVSVGTQLTDTAGLRYSVTIGGTYATNAPIAIASLDTGTATNHSAGDVLSWVTPPVGMAKTVSVNAGGLVGAVNAEDDETSRARAIARLQNPPAGGNSAQIAALCTQASPNVQAGFVYPAVNGPATVHAAVVAYATSVASSTARNRDIDSVTLNSYVIPFVQGQLGEYVESVITTVINAPTDIAINLSLPASPLASPPGPGGGWLDGAPWPTNKTTSVPYGPCPASNNGAGSFLSTRFSVVADVAPTLNVSRVAFVDPTTWTLYTAKVIAVNNGASPWDITIDSPFPNAAFGSYVFPQAANQANYLAAILAAFAAMGPGEKTANAAVLARGFRHPVPQLAWPYSLTDLQLRYLTSGTQTIPASPEVISAAWAYRSTTTPAVPGAVSGAPSILVPRSISFYPA